MRICFFFFPQERVRKLILMRISVRISNFQWWKPSLREYLRIKSEVLYYKFTSKITNQTYYVMGKKRPILINEENKITKYFQSKEVTKLIKIIDFHLIFSLTAFLILKLLIRVGSFSGIFLFEGSFTVKPVQQYMEIGKIFSRKVQENH